MTIDRAAASEEPPPVRRPHRLEAVVDAGELGQHHVEGAGEGGDGEQRLGLHPHEALERWQLDVGRRRHVLAKRLQLRLGEAVPRRRRQAQGLEEAEGGGEVGRTDGAQRGRDRRCRADELGERRQQLGAVHRLEPRARRLLGGAEVDEDRAALAHDDVAGMQGAMGEPAGVEPPDLAPDGVEEVGVELGGVELVEPAPVDVLEGQRHRAVRQLHEGFDGGARHPRPRRQHEEEGLVLDVVGERRGRPVVAGVAEDDRPVAAEQQIGVAAVLGVHLDEAWAGGAGGQVQLRPATLGPGERQAVELDTSARPVRRGRRPAPAGGSVNRTRRARRCRRWRRRPTPAAARGRRRCRRSPWPARARAAPDRRRAATGAPATACRRPRRRPPPRRRRATGTAARRPRCRSSPHRARRRTGRRRCRGPRRPPPRAAAAPAAIAEPAPAPGHDEPGDDGGGHADGGHLDQREQQLAGGAR